MKGAMLGAAFWHVLYLKCENFPLSCYTCTVQQLRSKNCLRSGANSHSVGGWTAMRLPCFCACGRSARVLAHGGKHADSSDEDGGIPPGTSGTKQPRPAEAATAWRAVPRKPQPSSQTSGKSGRQGRPVTATAAWPKVKDKVKEDSMVVRSRACSTTPVTSFAILHLGATPRA